MVVEPQEAYEAAPKLQLKVKQPWSFSKHGLALDGDVSEPGISTLKGVGLPPVRSIGTLTSKAGTTELRSGAPYHALLL